PQRIAWLGDAVAYPMKQGAAAAVYYGDRLYQFPLGVLGIAVATAIFPLLSRHAVRGDHRQLGADLTLGLRMVMMLGIPASVGLILLAEPIASLLFQHGEFTAEDAVRTSQMIRCYAIGVWAFCALPVIVRGFYAIGDRVTPVRVGMGMVGLNLALNLTLIWFWAECGLAVSTAISAALQVVLLAAIFSRRRSRIYWRPLFATILRAGVATLLMWLLGHLVLSLMPEGTTVSLRAVRTLVPLVASVAVYLATYTFLGGRELKWLFRSVK
ncbi:MAG: lipid II flippase MurJ, partial [Planctomycetia bacterium]